MTDNLVLPALLAVSSAHGVRVSLRKLSLVFPITSNNMIVNALLHRENINHKSYD